MIHAEPFVYQDVDQPFEGLIAWDTTTSGPKPAVMVVHTFRGQGDFENEKAIELAKLGYVGIAIDMYGRGNRAKDADEASALMASLNTDRPLLAQRIVLALGKVHQHPEVDKDKVGAIGFCFGGKCVLDLARTGIDLKGVVSFHGIFDPPGIEYPDRIKASVLVLHGWDDPLAKPDAVVALTQELTERQADWQIHGYGHTGHAFTNPNATAKAQGMFFHEKANARSWKAMKDFFEALFA